MAMKIKKKAASKMKNGVRYNDVTVTETWIDLVHQHWGKCTDQAADALLWSCTAFPVDDHYEVAKQLKVIRDRSGGDVQKAIDICRDEYDEGLKDLAEVAQMEDREDRAGEEVAEKRKRFKR